MEIAILCLLAIKGFFVWREGARAERAAYIAISALAALAMATALISPNASGLLDWITGGR